MTTGHKTIAKVSKVSKVCKLELNKTIQTKIASNEAILAKLFIFKHKLQKTRFDLHTHSITKMLCTIRITQPCTTSVRMYFDAKWSIFFFLSFLLPSLFKTKQKLIKLFCVWNNQTTSLSKNKKNKIKHYIIRDLCFMTS